MQNIDLNPNEIIHLLRIMETFNGVISIGQFNYRQVFFLHYLEETPDLKETCYTSQLEAVLMLEHILTIENKPAHNTGFALGGGRCE